MTEPRKWLFGLTADEWLHLTSEGDKSEVPPCCGNIGTIRDSLRMFTWFQGDDDTAWQKMAGEELLAAVEADGDEHGLQDREGFPLLHRVLDGIRKQAAEAGAGT
jgi:hypothetical protein